MRIPCQSEDKRKTHFLTDYYAMDKFKLPMVPFLNQCCDAYLKFYNKPKIRIKGNQTLLSSGNYSLNA